MMTSSHSVQVRRGSRHLVLGGQLQRIDPPAHLVEVCGRWSSGRDPHLIVLSARRRNFARLVLTAVRPSDVVLHRRQLPSASHTSSNGDHEVRGVGPGSPRCRPPIRRGVHRIGTEADDLAPACRLRLDPGYWRRSVCTRREVLGVLNSTPQDENQPLGGSGSPSWSRLRNRARPRQSRAGPSFLPPN